MPRDRLIQLLRCRSVNLCDVVVDFTRHQASIVAITAWQRDRLKRRDLIAFLSPVSSPFPVDIPFFHAYYSGKIRVSENEVAQFYLAAIS
jgi:hypothetical protein